MLQKIIDFSIENKLVIVLFLLALIGMGVYSLYKLPIDAVPDITDNQVQIITTVPSLGAPDIERLITTPIEQANTNIPGIKNMRSFSRFGLSLVTIVFNDDVDLYWARQQISERLQSVKENLPPGLGKPELAPVSTGLGEIYQYVLRPEKGFEKQFDASYLRTLQDWTVRKQLLHVDGVADVSSFGGDLKQYEVAIDPNLLKSYQITLEEVFTALNNNNTNTGGSYIENGPNVLFIRTEGLVGSLDDISKIVVKNTPDGMPILIQNVAKVSFAHAIKYGAMVYNGQEEVAGAVVLMLKGANSSEVVNDVKQKVVEIQKMLPKGVKIEAFLDRSKMVTNAIDTVKKNLIEGALIVIFILVLFLGNIRIGLITASIIPLSMLFAIIMMHTFGVSGNLMSLGAIDFGLIVDGAVIIVEAIMFRLYHSNQYPPLSQVSKSEMNKTVSQSAGKMMNAAVFGQLIILIVYLPIFSLQGIEGKMFKPMAQTVAFALLGAFILSLTYIPMMSAWFLNKKIPDKSSWSDRQMKKIESHFIAFFKKIISFPKTVLLIVLSLFGLSLLVLSFMGGEFIPELEEGDFAIETRALPGTNLSTVIERTNIAAKLLIKSFPEVEKVVAKIGSAEIPTDPMPIEAIDLMVILKPKSTWKTVHSFPEMADTMNKKLTEVPGLSFGFMYPVQMRFNELMTGAKQDVVCKIYGENLDTLSAYAKQLGKIIKNLEGSKETYIETITGVPQIVVSYNRAAIAQYGVSIANLNNAVNTAFAGKSAGLVFEGEKRFDLVVRLDAKQRKNLSDIQNLLISTPKGLQLPLSTFADVSMHSSANQIQRENSARRITVGFNIDKKDVQSVVLDLQKRCEQKLKLPQGYYITYGGSFENLQMAKTRLAIAVPIALLLIFVLLFFAFKSVKQAVLIYSAIPLSSIGGILFLSLRGMPFSISAGIGFIALWGVAVLNGIVLITEFNQLRKAFPEKSLKDILIEGTKSRLRPVLMTACVASMGFIPMALSTGAGAEVQRPLATVVIGGLISATFLTLFVLPILYQKTMNFRLKPSKLVLVLLFLAFSFSAFSQKKIQINVAIDSANTHFSALVAQKMELKYYQQMQQTSAADMSKAALTFEYGHLNSKAIDEKVSLNQSFSFPSVYKAQKNIYIAETERSNAGIDLKKLDLNQQVRTAFYTYLIAEAKEKILNSADSLFKNIVEKAKLKVQVGESNALELQNSENQLAQIKMQLLGLQKQKAQELNRFQYLINTQEKWIPESNELKMESLNFNPLIEKHPSLSLLEKETQIIHEQKVFAKKKNLPDINLGYFNQSFVGWQKVKNEEVYFGNNTRFQGLSVGLDVKLFGLGAQKRKIKSFDILLNQQEWKETALKEQLNNELYFWTQEWQNAQKNLQQYEQTLLKNNEKTLAIANKRLQMGEINYFNWLLLVQNCIQIQSSYLETVAQYNQSIIQLLNFKN